jgi:tripartite-type tricarboxylate transporter receptor subunit TctC
MGMKVLGALVFALAFAAPALAQEWPARPVRFIIPSGPGGLMESVLAATRERIEQQLGQRIVVENRGGGGGTIGAQAVLAAGADGYTFLLTPSNVLVINQFLAEKPSFDPLREFAPISMLIDVPLVLSVSDRFAPRTLRELIDYSRAHPGKVNFGSPGPSTPPHMAGEMLGRAGKLDMVHVPYKGGAAAATALITNEVQLMIIGYATLRGQIGAGQVRPVAVAAAERLAALPDVPTFAEAGFPEIQAEMPRSWWGLAAPRGVPEAAIRRLHAVFRAALLEPAARKKIEEAGLAVIANDPEAFTAQLPAEARKWESIVRALNLR